MTYNNFCDAFRSQFCAHTGVPFTWLKYYTDGWRGSGSKYDNWLIRDTNSHYDKAPSKHLQGDYLIVADPEDEILGITRFSMDLMYKIFQDNGWDGVWSFVDWSMDYAEENSVSDLFGSRSTYEDVKDRLIVRALNYQINKAELKDSVFRKIGDIALVLFAADKNDPTMCTLIDVPDDMPEKWGVDEQTIFDDALRNTFFMFPPRLHNNLHDAFHGTAADGRFMEPGSIPPQLDPKVVSFMVTYPNNNGTMALFYPGVKERVAEIIGGSYYIGFLDAYTIMLLNVGSGHDPRKIKSLLKGMAKHTAPIDVITRNVYLYDAEKGELEMMNI